MAIDIGIGGNFLKFFTDILRCLLGLGAFFLGNDDILNNLFLYIIDLCFCISCLLRLVRFYSIIELFLGFSFSLGFFLCFLLSRLFHLIFNLSNNLLQGFSVLRDTRGIEIIDIITAFHHAFPYFCFRNTFFSEHFAAFSQLVLKFLGNLSL